MESTSGKGTTPTAKTRTAATADTGSNYATDAAADVIDAAATTIDVNQNEHEPSVIPQIDGNASFSSVSSSNSYNRIPVHISDTRNPTSHVIRYGPQNLQTIQRSNKLLQALHLPKLCNINPQSVYNKREEFITFVKEMESDIIFISESHERPELTLDQIMLDLEDHLVVSNVHQRQGKGGRPALIINNRKYHVQNLTQSVTNIPWGVEVVWALLTPLHTQSDSIVQKIVCASIYLPPGRPGQSHTLLIDHITDVFNILSYKYPKGLHWIMAGDLNRMNLYQVLALDKRFKQIVQNPTRLNPPAILDPIIMTLSQYYQIPVCLPPLGSDSGKSESDHLTVVSEPLSVLQNKPARTKRQVRVRRMPESGQSKFNNWISQHNWSELISTKSGHDKATILQNTLLEKLNLFMPEKIMTFSSDDQPFFTPELKTLNKRKRQEYRRHRRSHKWKALNKEFKKKVASAKSDFYNKKNRDLKDGEPGQLYSKLKRLCSYHQQKSAEIICEEINDLSDQE